MNFLSGLRERDLVKVKKECTKEKGKLWLWERPSRSSSISSFPSPPHTTHYDTQRQRRAHSQCRSHSQRGSHSQRRNHDGERSNQREVALSRRHNSDDDRHRPGEGHHRSRKSRRHRRRSEDRTSSPRREHKYEYTHHHHYHTHLYHHNDTPNQRSPDIRHHSPPPKKEDNHKSLPKKEVRPHSPSKKDACHHFPSPKQDVRGPAPSPKKRRRVIVLKETPPKNPKSKMEEVNAFSYGGWRKRETACVATETVVAPSVTLGKSEESDCDNTYGYVAMREPGPQDAVPIAYAYYTHPPYGYVYPQQPAPAATTTPAPAPALSVAPPRAPSAAPAISVAPAASVAPAPPPSAASEQCDEDLWNYVAEKVTETVVEKREKSVRAASPPRATAEPRMAYACPAVAASPAFPIAYAMPDHPVPVHPVKDRAEGKRTWVGRTKKQVDEDNAKIAHREGVYKPNEIMPKNATPDQLFWVVEPDQTNTLRNYRTIEEDLQPGRWKIDSRYGNAYFIRAPKHSS